MNQLHELLGEALLSTKHVQHCAIIRVKDASLRASSVGLTLDNDQINRFVMAVKDPATSREEGLMYDGKKYKVVRADKQSVYAKYVSLVQNIKIFALLNKGKEGIIISITANLMILSIYNDSMHSSICVEATEKLGEYFREKDR
ncbi:Profilin-4 [Trichoplax sp. H2]|nr:Profilin-4 [Trichoplax sp. H2]|eukprot:RDD41890.1 Profilin-4 [Trichoplax sp. H2]